MHDDDDDVKRRARVNARSPTLLSLVSFARARFFVVKKNEPRKGQRRRDVGKKTRKREKKIEMYSHHRHLFLAKRRRAVGEGRSFFFLSLCVFLSPSHDCNGRVYAFTHEVSYNRKVYKFYFVISDIIKIQVGCMPVLVRIPQNYSRSLYSLCVFVYVISTVYLFFLYSYIFLF